ncbi:hypothetical protein [Paraburkholderia sp. BCC1884]|uniref:hypothetical protein n=1 Tax=Paraburkholderia sp. BCC1884 TaxID=2562668 RepID=UPI0011834994|nr:hypothetical protein [Paraburkholderia sp. BCC1884]
MSVAVAVFVVTATLAVYACFASRLGAWQAIPLTAAVAGLLMLCAARRNGALPVALKIAPAGLSVWDRAGKLLVQGRIAGCSQWSDRLLVLAVAPETGRTRTVLLSADALPAAVFRELAVLGRRAAGA